MYIITVKANKLTIRLKENNLQRKKRTGKESIVTKAENFRTAASIRV